MSLGFQKEGKGDTDWAFDLVNSLSKIEASVILKVLGRSCVVVCFFGSGLAFWYQDCFVIKNFVCVNDDGKYSKGAFHFWSWANIITCDGTVAHFMLDVTYVDRMVGWA